MLHTIKKSEINDYNSQNREETNENEIFSITEKEIKTGKEKIDRYICKICGRNFDNFRIWYKHHNSCYNMLANSKNFAVRTDPNHERPFSADQKELERGFDNLNNKIKVKASECQHSAHKFTSRGKYKRLKFQHPVTKKSSTLNKCLDCLLVYDTRDLLREHLHNHHDLDMTPVHLYFPKMEEFYSWKSNIERETLTTYQQKVYLQSQQPTIKYYCARSGKSYPSKNKKGSENYRMSRMRDTIKLGITCTAEIQAQLCGNEVVVKHYPLHYGHDKIVTKLSPEEQSAVDELTEKGFSSEKLLQDLTVKESVDVFQMYPIRKRHLNWVRYAYKAEEFDNEMSDFESVSDWVKKCSNMDECPVLFCLQENIATENEKFILIIMTEFQKQILASASKQVICVDVINRLYDVHLVTILVIDELQTSFPVAYCLSNRLNKDVMKQFYTCVKENAGTLSPEYLMTNHNLYLFESWVEVMNNRPHWLWSRWDTESTIRDQLKCFVRKNPPKRRELYSAFQTILDCKSKDVTIHMFKSLIDKIQRDEKFKKLGERAMKRFGSDVEKWAMCFQREVKTRTILYFEIMHHVFFICCTLGKGKKLYTFLRVIMKVLRHKILDRILNSFDDGKINLAINAIDFCHAKGIDLPTEKIFPLSKNVWTVELDETNKVYVVQDMDKCPDHCSLRCKQCEICVHQFSCSCVNSMIDANLCLHIHAIVYKLLRPRKFQSDLFDKLLDLDANSSNENHTLDSTLLESCETAQTETEPSLSRETCSISVKRSTAENIPVLPIVHYTSPVLITTPRGPYVPKLVSSKLSSENLPLSLRTEKSKDISAPKFTSILKRKHEREHVESKIPQLNNVGTFKDMFLEKPAEAEQPVNCESVTMPLEHALKKPKISQKTEETRNSAFKKAVTLSEILKTQKLSRDSLTAINKCLNACINIANTNKKEITKTANEISINAIYVIKPQNKVLELVPSTTQNSSGKIENYQIKVQKIQSNLTHNPHILTISGETS